MTTEEKAELFDLWNKVYRLPNIYDFDNTMSAEELLDTLQDILLLQ